MVDKVPNELKQVGLVNTGETGYLNTFIQLLNNLPGYVKFLTKLSQDKNVDSKVLKGFVHIFESTRSEKHAISTSDLIDALAPSIPFDLEEMQDLCEFGMMAFEALDEQLKKAAPQEWNQKDWYEGILCDYIKGIKVEFNSSRTSSFIMLPATIKNHNNLHGALK